MKGIDGKHALSKMGRAHLCVKRKNLIAKENEAIQAFYGRQAFAQATVPAYN